MDADPLGIAHRARPATLRPVPGEAHQHREQEANGDAVLLRRAKIGGVGEKREHGPVHIGDDAAIDGRAQDQGGYTLRYRPQIVRG